MASSRTAAQRRRAKAIARESARPVATAPPPEEIDVDDSELWSVPERRWPWIVGIVVCLAGLGVASYLTLAHYTTTVTLACPEGHFVNCAKVTTSQYSKIFGIPVAVLGLVFFAGMLPLQLPVAWRSAHPWVRIGRLAGTVIGVGMVVWLVYAELFLIGSICIYCTTVHALTFLLFVAVVFGTISTTPEPQVV